MTEIKHFWIEYSNHLNTEHLKSEHWLSGHFFVQFSNGMITWLGVPLKKGTFLTIIQAVFVRFSDHHPIKHSKYFKKESTAQFKIRRSSDLSKGYNLRFISFLRTYLFRSTERFTGESYLGSEVGCAFDDVRCTAGIWLANIQITNIWITNF